MALSSDGCTVDRKSKESFLRCRKSEKRGEKIVFLKMRKPENFWMGLFNNYVTLGGKGGLTCIVTKRYVKLRGGGGGGGGGVLI